MANKDGEHPEFDDMNFSEDELSDLNEGGSDALNFSEMDSSGSELGNSDLFDFDQTDAPETSSLDLADLGDEPATEEVAAEPDLVESDLAEPDLLDATAADAEPEVPVDKKAKGKKAKAKKEKKPKKVKEKKVKERKPSSPSDKPGFMVEVKKASPFTVMLFLSAASLFIAVLILAIEWSSYGFTISGS